MTYTVTIAVDDTEGDPQVSFTSPNGFNASTLLSKAPTAVKDILIGLHKADIKVLEGKIAALSSTPAQPVRGPAANTAQ